MPKPQSKITVESLEPLIEELTKDKPNAHKVKKMMVDQGLQYTSDHIQQMGMVLSVMSGLTTATRQKKSAELADL